jgi:hypothetical protein
MVCSNWNIRTWTTAERVVPMGHKPKFKPEVARALDALVNQGLVLERVVDLHIMGVEHNDPAMLELHQMLKHWTKRMFEVQDLFGQGGDNPQ